MNGLSPPEALRYECALVGKQLIVHSLRDLPHIPASHVSRRMLRDVRYVDAPVIVNNSTGKQP